MSLVLALSIASPMLSAAFASLSQSRISFAPSMVSVIRATSSASYFDLTLLLRAGLRANPDYDSTSSIATVIM